MKLSTAALAKARSLIKAGAVNHGAESTIFRNAEDALCLARDKDGKHRYPCARLRGGKMLLYRSALRAIRSQSSRRNEREVYEAAGELLDMLDDKELEMNAQTHTEDDAAFEQYAAAGVQFVIGRLKGEDSTTVQTVLFDKESWDAKRAKAWLKEHDMTAGKIDETGGKLRFRQRDPGDFEGDSLRTMQPGKKKEMAEDDDADEGKKGNRKVKFPFPPKKKGKKDDETDDEDSDAEDDGETDDEDMPDKDMPDDEMMKKRRKGMMKRKDKKGGGYSIEPHPDIEHAYVFSGLDADVIVNVYDADGDVLDYDIEHNDDGGCTLKFADEPDWPLSMELKSHAAEPTSTRMPASNTTDNNGVTARIGKVIRDWQGRTDMRGLSQIQAYLFDRKKFTLSKAMKWLRENQVWPEGFDEEEGAYTFPIRPADQFDEQSFKTVDYTNDRHRVYRQGTDAELDAMHKYEDGEPILVYGDKAEKGTAGHMINGVEVFRVGTWNKDTYTRDDLEAMVKAFDKVGFRPPVKLGHKEESGSPAYGWVKSLRRVGDKLVADLQDIPKKIYDAIKKRQFDTVSSEVYWNLDRNGTKFPRALKAIALLGAEIPAVSGLAPLRTTVASLPTMSGDGRVLSYTFKTEVKMAENELTVEQLQAKLDEANAALKSFTESGVTPDTAKAMKETIDTLTRKHAEGEERERKRTVDALVARCTVPALRPHLTMIYDLLTKEPKTVSFKQGDKEIKDPVAVVDAMVEHLNKMTRSLFKQVTADDVRANRDEIPADSLSPGEASAVVHQRTMEHMEKNSVKDYGQAMAAVLNADPALKRAYAQS